MPFPDSIHALPKASLLGVDVYVHDDGKSQVLFMELPAHRPEILVPTHTHDVEWGIVVEGEIEITVNGRAERHGPGETHFIPAQAPHSIRFTPGTSSVHHIVGQRVKIA